MDECFAAALNLVKRLVTVRLALGCKKFVLVHPGEKTTDVIAAV